MSSRRVTSNRIRGPQSALTDFLASNNISAAQISSDYQRRQAEARQREQEEAAAQGRTDGDGEDKENEDDDDGETAAELQQVRLEAFARKQKKKREQEKSVAKIKASKKLQAQKQQQKKKRKSAGDSDSGDEFDEDVWDTYTKKKQPLPGQLENCELCDKRFTVTPYSKTGPDGGLLCVKCSKEQEAGRKKGEKTKKQAAGRDKRRKVQSNLLDGIVQVGSKSLQELCIKEVATNIHEVDEFGDLPPTLLKRLSQILSKRRILTSQTLDLFLRSEFETIDIYDCGKLETEDYIKMFAVVPGVRNLNLRNAGQFKDEVLDYIMERDVPLRQLQLHAANLVSTEKWIEFFTRCGHRLETLKLSWLDNSMNDAAVEHLVTHCPNLTRLKLKKCFKMSDGTLQALSQLRHLRHLSLQLPPTATESLTNLIAAIGAGLETLSLENFTDADDNTLAAIHTHCRHLSKLRITHNDVCTDAGFVNLFTNWANPPLSRIDLNSTRSLDYETPDGPTDNPIGLGSAGFVALMTHSRPGLTKLDVSSCRHISREVFAETFVPVPIAPTPTTAHCVPSVFLTEYPCLREINISFLPKIDTVIVRGMFRTCPQLAKVIVFGCFNVTDVQVPLQVALIGLPNAQESIVLTADGSLGGVGGDVLI